MSKYLLSAAATLAAFSFSSHAALWSQTQLHLNKGEFKNPFSQVEANTTITSLQHSSAWQYGDNFFFVDVIKDDFNDGYQDSDYYGEWYSTVSLSALADSKMQFGAIKDVGLVMGINVAGDADVTKYLPGVKLSWDVPGFVFLNTLVTAYIDDSEGVLKGGAPKEDNSWMVDVAWGYPFTLGEQKFNFTGHVEYIGKRTNEFGDSVNGWLLAQPAIQWDLGHALSFSDNTLMLGVEWQYWRNKLGTDTNESVPQLHLVWTF